MSDTTILEDIADYEQKRNSSFQVENARLHRLISMCLLDLDETNTVSVSNQKEVFKTTTYGLSTYGEIMLKLIRNKIIAKKYSTSQSATVAQHKGFTFLPPTVEEEPT